MTCNGQVKNVGIIGEYNQYRTMADLAFEDGNFEKAYKLYQACLTMVGSDEYATDRLRSSKEIMGLLNQLQLSTNSNFTNIEKALSDLQKNPIFAGESSFLRSKVLLILENTANLLLKKGNYDLSLNVYLLVYNILPVSGIKYKLERTNQKYKEKFGRDATAYTVLQKSVKQKLSQKSTVPSADEADELRKKAEDAFAKGEWDKAQKLYNASLVVGEGKRPEIEQRLIDIARNKNLERQKEEADKQSNFLLSAKTGEEMLKTRPDNVQLKSDIANNYQKQADKYYSEGRFADARDYYRKANEVEPNEGLYSKMENAEKKIGGLRLSYRRPQDRKAEKYEISQLPINDDFGVKISLEPAIGFERVNPTFIISEYQFIKLYDKAIYRPYFGFHVIFKNNKDTNEVVKFLTGLYMSPNQTFEIANRQNSSSTIAEKIQFSSLIIPFALRFTFTQKSIRPIFTIGVQPAINYNYRYEFYPDTKANNTISYNISSTVSIFSAIGIDCKLKNSKSIHFNLKLTRDSSKGTSIKNIKNSPYSQFQNHSYMLNSWYIGLEMSYRLIN